MTLPHASSTGWSGAGESERICIPSGTPADPSKVQARMLLLAFDFAEAFRDSMVTSEWLPTVPPLQSPVGKLRYL